MKKKQKKRLLPNILGLNELKKIFCTPNISRTTKLPCELAAILTAYPKWHWIGVWARLYKLQNPLLSGPVWNFTSFIGLL
jgi:hypothetical protein